MRCPVGHAIALVSAKGNPAIFVLGSLTLSFTLLGCGPPIGTTSNYLQPTTEAEQLPSAVNPCFLATDDDGSADYVRLMGNKDRGVVRVNGRPILLDYLGNNMRGGGVFRKGSLTVEISGIPRAAARSAERIGEEAIVSVTDRGISERFKALWTC